MPTSYKDHPTPVALGESFHTNPSFLEEGAEGERGGSFMGNSQVPKAATHNGGLNKSLPVVQG